MRALIFCAVVALASGAYAQHQRPAKTPSEKYEAYREAITDPPYGLAKVKALVNAVRAHASFNLAISDMDYAGLTVPEKFTYVMLHGENFSQMCSVPPPIVDADKKIFGRPASPFANEFWSKRQLDFLKQNRDQVIGLLRSTIATRHRAGANLKAAIVEVHAIEMMPELVALFNSDKKDADILSVLMLLMKDGAYKPFLASESFGTLYGKRASYQASIPLSPANAKFILDTALAYYRAQK